ncbi:Z1 domain-containing protein [Agromyces sp. SYSU K20354]|uniref:Z1 domain-containing protein n=1 Tax=Agromyces cavernae TaxID=2898659 RepID=UPI001E5F4B60|nr:Z1 domain-containing protein [Agromyces cavernae]MCD2441442.1 Z1 domain-containing protein [Agromyces cavernae]
MTSVDPGRPDWADTIRIAFHALGNQQPKPLSRLLSSLGDAEITDDDFISFISSADANDPARTQARISFGKWDAEANSPFAAAPRSALRREQIYDALEFSQPLRDAFTEQFPVFTDSTVVISKQFQPWYTEARKHRSNMYWDHYEAYLRDIKKWSPSAISSLDVATTDVVERLSDPTRDEAKQTKGLVVGYVQSGKTANFTGVAAKAIDAGYRLVIVLTGTIEILRAQTQRRMDMELIGRENILRGLDPSDPVVAKELDYQSDSDWQDGKFVRHGAMLEQPGVPHIDRVTTYRSDYKRLPQGLTKLRFYRADKQKPLNDPANLFNSDAYVAVIKKNKGSLEKLIADLKPHKGDLAQLPVLIIDDESDQASVDTTNPTKWRKNSAESRERTTINRLITEILGLCPRAQYVGYTATPFANVFVDPDDESDLFPSDFVVSLQRPPGYMGVREFHDIGRQWDDEPQDFANSNERAHVRALVGDADSETGRRESELQEALDAWVLSGAIKKFREARGARSYRHHTMLVHESVKTAEHEATADHVRALWHSSRFNSTEGLARLKHLYEEDFHPVMLARANGAALPADFDELRPHIGQALAQITIDGDPILIVNSDAQIKAQQKKLDFEADQVWRILIGGTQLSRGFTVEGLTVSYFRRKAGQADTLMQAGRWFGFRPGYQDLVRLYIRRDVDVDLYEAFEALLMDEEAFRSELEQYEGFDEHGMPFLEPRQIPPLVSQHLPWLKPTARNKMWNAVIVAKAPGAGFRDLFSPPSRSDAAAGTNMLDVGIPLNRVATHELLLPFTMDDGASGTQRFRAGLIPGNELIDILTEYKWHPGYSDVITPFLAFLHAATSDGRVREWLVARHQPSKTGITIDHLGEEIGPIVTRRRRPDPRIDFMGSDRKHARALEPIARGLDVEGLPGATGRGVLLTYLVDDRPDDAKASSPVLENLVPLLSFAPPKSATSTGRELIKWSVLAPARLDEAAIAVTGGA